MTQQIPSMELLTGGARESRSGSLREDAQVSPGEGPLHCLGELATDNKGQAVTGKAKSDHKYSYLMHISKKKKKEETQKFTVDSTYVSPIFAYSLINLKWHLILSYFEFS